MESTYSILFTNRTLMQLYTVWDKLRDKYQCRVEILKRLVHGLYSGYIVIRKEICIQNLGKMKAIEDIELHRAKMYKEIKRTDQSGIDLRMRAVAGRHYTIPRDCMSPKVIDILYSKTKLKRKIKQNKYEKAGTGQ